MGLLLLVAGPAIGADSVELERLKQLYVIDPSGAMQRSVELCKELCAANRLDDAQAVVETAWHWMDHIWGLRDELAETLASAAQAAGRWGIAAEGYRLLALGAHHRFIYYYADPRPQRTVHLAGLAEAAYARAGVNDANRDEVRRAAAEMSQISPDLPALLDAIGETWRDRMAAIQALVFEARDEDAVAAICAVVGELAHGPLGPETVPLVHQLGCFMWLRGSEAFAEQLSQIALRLDDSHALEGVLAGCCFTWWGRDDVYLRVFRECWMRRKQMPAMCSWEVSLMAEKMALFGLPDEANRVAADWCDLADRLASGAYWGHPMISRYTPDALMRRVVRAVLRPGSSWPVEPQTGASLRHVLWDDGPPQRRKQWCCDAAQQCVGAIALYRDAGSAISLLRAAAALYSQAGCVELAERHQAMAEALQQRDPAAVLACALTSARSQAAEGKWDEVTEALEPAAAGSPDSVQLLQAAVLLQEAALRLRKPAEAEKWMAKAKGLVDTLPMPSGEKANYLVTLAGLCDLAAQVAEGGTL